MADLTSLLAALNTLSVYAPCPHNNVDTSLGDGTTWCKCEDCGDTLYQKGLDKSRAAVKDFDRAGYILRAHLISTLGAATAPTPAPTPPARALSGFEKPLSEWTFQELVSVATWDVITGITQGHALKGLIHQALNFALIWKAEQNGKQK